MSTSDRGMTEEKWRRSVRKQIDGLYSRVEQERLNWTRESQAIRALIPLSDLQDRAVLQAEVSRLSAVVDWLVKQVATMQATAQASSEASDEAQRAERWAAPFGGVCTLCARGFHLDCTQLECACSHPQHRAASTADEGESR